MGKNTSQTQKKRSRQSPAPADSPAFDYNGFLWHLSEVRRTAAKTLDKKRIRTMLREHIQAHHLLPLQTLLLRHLDTLPAEVPALKYRPNATTWSILRQPVIRKNICLLRCLNMKQENIQRMISACFPRFRLSLSEIERFCYLFFNLPQRKANAAQIACIRMFQSFGREYEEFSNYALALRGELPHDEIYRFLPISCDPAQNIQGVNIMIQKYYWVLEKNVSLQDHQGIQKCIQIIKLFNELKNIWNPKDEHASFFDSFTPNYLSTDTVDHD